MVDWAKLQRCCATASFITGVHLDEGQVWIRLSHPLQPLTPNTLRHNFSVCCAHYCGYFNLYVSEKSVIDRAVYWQEHHDMICITIHGSRYDCIRIHRDTINIAIYSDIQNSSLRMYKHACYCVQSLYIALHYIWEFNWQIEPKQFKMSFPIYLTVLENCQTH